MSISTPIIWTNAQKIAFRFIALYGTIFMLSNQFITSYVFDALWRKAVPWFAKNVLGLAEDITIFTNGSGDTLDVFLEKEEFELVKRGFNWVSERPHNQ